MTLNGSSTNGWLRLCGCTVPPKNTFRSKVWLIVLSVLIFLMNNVSIYHHCINDGDVWAEDHTIAPPPNANNLKKRLLTKNFIFPTVEERVEYYMGSWYNRSLSVPKSAEESLLCGRLYVATSHSKIEPHRDTLYSFTNLQKRSLMPTFWQSVYLKDAANILAHVESHVDQGEMEEKYVILKTGDGYSPDENKPVVAKTRRCVKENEAQCDAYYQSIIWPLHMDHHFSSVNKLQSIKQTSWERKKEMVVWRGACTGVGGIHTSVSFTRLEFVQMHKDNKRRGVDIAFNDKCTNVNSEKKYTIDQSFYRSSMDMRKLLQSKYLLSLEGNDVSTGLKWMLASNSVVFMHPPSALSYTMESKLVPYVHYVPVQRNGSDLLEQLDWAKKNDKHCKWISRQASVYMYNLWSSPQARKDLILIKNLLGEIYHQKFSQALAVCHAGILPK